MLIKYLQYIIFKAIPTKLKNDYNKYLNFVLLTLLLKIEKLIEFYYIILLTIYM